MPLPPSWGKATALAPGKVPPPSLDSDKHKQARPELSGTGTKIQGIHKRETDGELVIFVLYKLRFPGRQGDDARGTGLEMKYPSTGLSFPR